MQTIRVVNYDKNIWSNGREYQWFPFAVKLPNRSEKKDIAGTIKLGNVGELEGQDARMLAAIDSVTEPIDLKIQIVLTNEPDRVEMELTGFKIKGVTVTREWVSADFVFEDMATEPFCGDTITPKLFPGAF